MKRQPSGWGSGMLGVIIFSGSLPATRIAVSEFTPIFLTSARAAIAAMLGALILLIRRQPKPTKADLLPLSLVAIGCVVGFPLLTALALKHITAAHSIVFIGLLPLSTAIFGVIRGGEYLRPAFWIFSIIGAAIVSGFAFTRPHTGGATIGDLYMIASILICGLGYAEGATLSKSLGGWQVISWALILSLPVMAIIAILNFPETLETIQLPAWLSLAYVSIFSMLIGFIFWYRGLALGGIAGVGQLQLLQPFIGLMLAAFILHEPVAWPMIISAAGVVLCVIGAKRFA